MPTYWYASKIGEKFWVKDSESEHEYDSYVVCQPDDATFKSWQWIDKIDCVEVIDGREHIISMKEAKILQRVANVFSIRPDSFEKFDLPSEFMLAYKSYLNAKDSFNTILKHYEFDELL